MSKKDYVVVWSGRDPLLPDRAERYDVRLDTMPSLDLDEPEPQRRVRKYTYTGRHKKGKMTHGGNNGKD